MISDTDYFINRREVYAAEFSPEIQARADAFLPKLNQLVERAADFGILVQFNQIEGDAYFGTQLNSGWRPPTVNAATPGASQTSEHMKGGAADLHDPDGDIDAWLMTPEGQFELEVIGLWLEHPDDTPGWCHVQDLPPPSGVRVFRTK